MGPKRMNRICIDAEEKEGQRGMECAKVRRQDYRRHGQGTATRPALATAES